ncbi:MAG TPA: acyl-CoA dehydrogenase family protein [Acidimicrobiales bacterium]|nr:acyl-CoA dehydrogenase family protein [Acidimicrobiales bacterium]
MDLNFTDEQQLLRETVRGLCQRHADLTVVRQLEDDPIGYSEKLWTALGETGLLDLSELSMLDAAIVYDEFGRSLSPSPHFASSVVSAGILGTPGTERIVVPAWLEPGRGFGPKGVTLDAGRLTGTKRHVPFAAAADELVVLCRDGGDVVYVRVDPKADGVTLTQQQTIASDTQYRIDFDGVTGEVIDRRGWDVFDGVMHDALILLAAQAAGGARAALDMTVQYAKDRQQFDKPLGAFQALAHYLADAVTTVDGAETLVWEAAWARDNGRSIKRLAPMAKLFATQTYRDVTAMAQQVFGGVGFTVDYDIQLYFRRAKQLQISWWDTRYLEELIAAEVLDS